MPCDPLTEELFDHTRKIHLEFSEGTEHHDRVVIISPACYKMPCIAKNQVNMIDNGYAFNNGILFYEQGSFLNFLERLC